jgi:hypothetical protein
MDLEESVKSRAYRTLRKMDSYRSLESNAPDYFATNLLREHERLIGVYENSPGKRQESIVLTSFGFHIFLNEQWQFIDYGQIVDVEPVLSIPKDKRSIEGLIVRIPGREITIPVRGGQEGFRDAWEFLRFLRRVTESFRVKMES